MSSLRRPIVAIAVAAALLLGSTACDKQPPKQGPVIVFGDSLAWQSRDYLKFLGEANGLPIQVKAAGGTAACDWVASIRTALEAPTKPRLIVLEFWGNNLTPCMGASKEQPTGYPLGSQTYLAKYRESLNAIRSAASKAGVPVVWAASPPRHYADADPDLNTVFEDMARRRGWRVIPSGEAVADAKGRWVRRLPCSDHDNATRSCVSGVVEVRAADHVHFATASSGELPGALRWAEAVIGALI